MKDISKTKSKKDCFANCNYVALLINLKWWFHDCCLPLYCFLQDHAMCLFWKATPICCIIARSKCNKVETNCRRQIQELYLIDVADQFVLWFLIVNKSVEWNVLSEAALLTSSCSAEKLLLYSCPLKVPVVDAEQTENSYKYSKSTTYGKHRLSHGEEREAKIKINGKQMNQKSVAQGRLGYEINHQMKKKTDKIMTVRKNYDKRI